MEWKGSLRRVSRERKGWSSVRRSVCRSPCLLYIVFPPFAPSFSFIDLFPLFCLSHSSGQCSGERGKERNSPCLQRKGFARTLLWCLDNWRIFRPDGLSPHLSLFPFPRAHEPQLLFSVFHFLFSPLACTRCENDHRPCEAGHFVPRK